MRFSVHTGRECLIFHSVGDRVEMYNFLLSQLWGFWGDDWQPIIKRDKK